MENCALPVGISALACAIADAIPNQSDLILLAALFTQLGDTLATIAAQQNACNP